MRSVAARLGRVPSTVSREIKRNAGPLNSYQLVLRTLMLMRDVSPAWLQHFP